MHKFFSFIFFLGLSLGLNAQTYTITGLVVNKTTDDILIGCSVYNVTKQRGTITNEEGKYKLTVDKGDLVQYTYIGMAIIERYIVDGLDIDVAMTYQTKRIKPVIIKSETLARSSSLFNPKYDKQKNERIREGTPRTADEIMKEGSPSVTSSGLTMSPITMLYYAFNKRERRRLDAIIDINQLDASNQKYSLDFISMVTKEEDITELRDIKAFCYFPHDRILGSTFYDLGLMLQDCYVEYLEDKKIHPKVATDSTKMDW
jgi:hypothetical protein